MEIRLATYTDLPALRGAYIAFCEEQMARMPIPYPRMDAEEYDNFVVVLVRALGQPSFRCWIAEGFGQEILGFLGASIEERAVSKPHRYGYVHWLWVRPDSRGHGIGRSLCAPGFAWYVSEGIEELEIRAIAGDEQWARRGWSPIVATHLVTKTAALSSWIHGVPSAAAEPAPPRRKRGRRPRVNGGADASR